MRRSKLRALSCKSCSLSGSLYLVLSRSSGIGQSRLKVKRKLDISHQNPERRMASVSHGVLRSSSVRYQYSYTAVIAAVQRALPLAHNTAVDSLFIYYSRVSCYSFRSLRSRTHWTRRAHYTRVRPLSRNSYMHTTLHSSRHPTSRFLSTRATYG